MIRRIVAVAKDVDSAADTKIAIYSDSAIFADVASLPPALPTM